MRYSLLSFLEDTSTRFLCYYQYVITVDKMKLVLTFKETNLLCPTSYMSCFQIMEVSNKLVVLDKKRSFIINKATTAILTKG